MACGTLIEVEKDCNGNTGGLEIVLYNDQDNVSEIAIDVNDIIQGMTITEVFKGLFFKRGQANFIEEEQTNLDEGSSFIKGTLSISLKRREAFKSKVLKEAGAGQRELSFIVKDFNGIWWLLQNMQLATNTGGSGAVKADGSKYDVAFVGEYIQLSNEIAESLIVDLIQENLLFDEGDNAFFDEGDLIYTNN